ncbi:MAG: hypothetical protein QE278_01510 [Limnobacter sp.]|nr:hypothetical protein [Limnobacter sp.]
MDRQRVCEDKALQAATAQAEVRSGDVATPKQQRCNTKAATKQRSSNEAATTQAEARSGNGDDANKKPPEGGLYLTQT